MTAPRGFGRAVALMLALPVGAQAAPVCPQATLVVVPGQGEGVVEATAASGDCAVRLADGRLFEAPTAALVPLAAGDSPPEPALPPAFLRCAGAGDARLLALAPGLYILAQGGAGSLRQSGGEIGFDSGPLQGHRGRITETGLILTPPEGAAQNCTPLPPG